MPSGAKVIICAEPTEINLFAEFRSECLVVRPCYELGIARGILVRKNTMFDDFENEDDLTQLLRDRVPESLHLDYKRSDSLGKTDQKRRELAKDVAAMATAEGGVLLYGIVEEDDTHEAKQLDGGYDQSEISKEWIEQVIDSNISPRIDGLRIKAIELTTTSPGRYAYAVLVPPSDRAPHMVGHRYYTRRNFQSMPMEDYQVRDVMFRRRVPRLEITSHAKRLSNCVSVRFGAQNVGLIAAENLYFEVEFLRRETCPDSWFPMDCPPTVFVRTPDSNPGQRTYVLSYTQTDAPAAPGYPQPKRLPHLIFPGMAVIFEELSIAVRNDASSGLSIDARLYARDMPVVRKAIPVSSLFQELPVA